MEAIDEYFPFLSFDAPFGYVQERLDTINNIPATVMKGVLNKNTLHRFLKEADLADLHELFEREQFQDLLHDHELRRKIEGMAICKFRPHEIEQEVNLTINEIDPVIIRVYLDCFVNYHGMDFNQKKNFINETFENMDEKKTLLQCLESKLKDRVRILLHLSSRTYNPVEMINEVARIITLKTTEGFRDDNEEKLQSYLKLGLKTAEALQKVGVGNKDAAEQLLAALSKKPEDVGVVTPKPMSVEQLEDMFLENQRPPKEP